MTNPMIDKYHYAKDAKTYAGEVSTGKLRNAWPANLTLRELLPNLENFTRLIDKVSEKWHWNLQPRYNDGSLNAKLAHPETRLFELVDGEQPVGYAFITSPGTALRQRFWNAANDVRVIEIENLGLFPGCEGGGRGKAYFEMCFDMLFKDYDVVYWSQNNVHSPSLSQFYQDRLGMRLLATDRVEDFRPATTQTALANRTLAAE